MAPPRQNGPAAARSFFTLHKRHNFSSSDKILALTPHPEHSGHVASGGIRATWYQVRSSAFPGSTRRLFRAFIVPSGRVDPGGGSGRTVHEPPAPPVPFRAPWPFAPSWHLATPPGGEEHSGTARHPVRSRHVKCRCRSHGFLRARVLSPRYTRPCGRPRRGAKIADHEEPVKTAGIIHRRACPAGRSGDGPEGPPIR